MSRSRKFNSVCFAIALLSLVILPAFSLPRVVQTSTAACSSPSFLFAQPLHPLATVDAVATGDFNGDSHLDSVIITGDDLALLLGNGSGGLGTPATFFVGAAGGPNEIGEFRITVVDLNGDQKLDVIVADYHFGFPVGNNLSVLLGNGAGGFAPRKAFSTGTVITDLTTGDFNGDGKLDVATSTFSGVWVLPGDGTGSFGTPTQYQTGTGSFNYGIKAADFNGDSKPDLVTANYNADSVSVFLNNGAGGFAAPRTFAAYRGPASILIGDFNGDNKADVVTTSSTGEVPNAFSVMLGDGAGNLAAPINITGFGVNSITSGDFNGDGKPDLVTTGFGDDSLFVHLGDGTGHFGTPNAFDPGRATTPTAVAAGDLNEDGKLDVVTNTAAVILGDGTGRMLTAARFRSGGDNPDSIAIGDFNEDGKPDLAVANFGTSNVSILLGDGAGVFGAPTNFQVASSPLFIAVADFNGDDHLDFVTVNSFPFSQGTVTVMFGGGTGNFGGALNFSTGNNPRSLVVGDFNNDGKLDFVVANHGHFFPSSPGASAPASITMHLGNGQGNFGTQTLDGFPPLSNRSDDPLSIAAADLNNDGKLDLVVGSSTTISVRLGNGAGDFGPAINLTSPASVTAVLIGDFNGDNKQDLVTTTFVTNTAIAKLSLRLGDGSGNFGPASELPGFGSNPFPRAADFNGDGDLDLAVAASNLWVMFGDGAGNFGLPTKWGSPPSTSVAVDDLNGDGKPDIATTNSAHYVTILINTCGASVIPTPTPTPTPSPTPSPSPTPTPPQGPVLLTEENSSRAIALDSVTSVRDPFSVHTIHNFSSDQHRRIMLFATNVDLLPGEDKSVVTAQAETQGGEVVALTVEHVGKVPGLDRFTQINVRLPDELEAAGDVQVSVRLRGVASNKVLIKIIASPAS